MKFLLSIFRNKSLNIIKKYPHSIFTLFLTISLFLVSADKAKAQCTTCNTTYTDETINSSVSLTGTVCFNGTSNTIQGDISSIADGTIICVSPGTTLNLNSNNYNNIAGSVTVNVYGTLKFGTNPNLAGKWTFNIYSGGTMNYGSLGFNSTTGNLTINNQGTFSGGKLEITGSSSTGSVTNTGAMTLNDDLNFAGSTFTFYNNSPTTINLKTIALSNSTSTFTFTNYTVMNVSSTLNLNNGTGQFKNLGTLTVNQNYNSSSTSTYINCGTYSGSFNLNNGGRVINTGTFTTSQISYGGPISRVENYGHFNVNGNIILGGIQNNDKSVFYNQGIVTLSGTGKIQNDGNLEGPSDTSKKGYFVWSGQNGMNGGTIGPNLNFRNANGTSDVSTMFNNSSSTSYIWQTGITWGGTEPTTLPATDCPNPDGTPAVPVPLSTSVCKGIDLTTLQPNYSNITYEWWTGTSTTRTTQITGSSLTNYTTAENVYLWAKNVSNPSTKQYSASGAAVTVNADPTVTISPSSSSVCAGASVTLTASVSNGVGTVASYQWMSCTSSGGTYSNISGATGSTFTPPTSTIGIVYYKVYITQTGGGCDGTSDAASVTTSNCPPVATNDMGTVNENATLTVAAVGVLSNDTDPNGDALAVSAIRTGTEADTGTSGTVGTALNGTYGTLTIQENGSYTYSASLSAVEALAAGATAVDYFTYTVSDGKGGTDLAQLAITITGTNDAPVVAAITKTGTEDTDITFIASDFTSKFTDVDGNSLTKIKVVDLPANGTLKLNGVNITVGQEIPAADLAKITFTPAANWNGSTSFNWNGYDGTTYAVSNAAVNITVTAVNDAPVAVNDINTTNVNQPVSGQVLTNDSDSEGNGLTVTTQTNVATPHGTVTVNSNGTYTYTPANGYTGTDTFSYQVCDNGTPSQCSTATVTINVVPLTSPLTNDPPVANNDTYTVEQAQTATVKILANDSDPDGNTLAVTSVTGLNNSGGSITLTTSAQNVYNSSGTLAGTALLDDATGNIVFVPAAGYTGNVPFNYTISDGNGGTASASALITVLPANATNNVYANDDANTAPAGTTMTGNILTNDSDPEGNAYTVTAGTANGTTLTIGISTAIPGVGTLTLSSDGVYTFVPATGFTGTVNVPYNACDDGTPKACDQATLYLTSLNSGVKLWTGITSTDFNTNSNWTMGIVPVNGDDIVFATVANNNGNPAVNNLIIPTGTEKIINNLTNASGKALVVPAETGVIVNGIVSGFETSPDKLQLLAEADKANGTFIALNNCGTTILGTVQLYAKGKKGNPVTWTDNIAGSPTIGVQFTSSYQWQFFGVPVETVKASPTFDGSFLRRYNETINNTTGNNGNGSYYYKWEKLNNSSDLTAFTGYEITQNNPTIYTLKGKLQLCDHTIKLQRTAVEVPGSTDTNEANKRYGLGQNIFGNSFTAAIPVKDLTFPDNVEKTVYLYNTGSFAEWAAGSISENTTTAGAYLSIPYNTSAALDVQIPSMQGFLLLHTGTFGSFIDMSLPYAKLTKNLKPQTAPRAALSFLSVELDSKTTRDQLWLFSQEETTAGFDNGWDGRKFFGTPTAFIYTENADGPMQVNTDKTIDGSVLCFYANDDTDYTLKLTKSNLANYPDLKLIDLVTRTVISLTGDITTYRFTADNKGNVVRRFIVANSAFIDFNSEKFKYLDGYIMNNNRLIVTNLTPHDGTLHLYDISGRTILSRNISPAVTEIPVQLPTGIYILKLQSGGKSETIKLMIK